MENKTFDAIAHVDGLFDIIGKTVENVTYGPPQHNESSMIFIQFTDGTNLIVTAATFESADFNVEL